MSVITPQKNAVNHSEPSLSEKKKQKTPKNQQQNFFLKYIMIQLQFLILK